MEALGLVFWAIILFVIYAVLRGMFGSNGKISDDGKFICTACGSRGSPATITKGSLLIEIVLWLCFIIPGLIYTIWRLTSRYSACPACQAPGMIPADSPNGRRLVEQSRQPK